MVTSSFKKYSPVVITEDNSLGQQENHLNAASYSPEAAA